MRQQLHCVAKAQTACVQMDKKFEVKNTICVACWQQGGKQSSTSIFFGKSCKICLTFLQLYCILHGLVPRANARGNARFCGNGNVLPCFRKSSMLFLLNEAPQSTSKQKAKEKLKKSFKNFKKTLEKQLTQKVSCSRISRLLKRQRRSLKTE